MEIANDRLIARCEHLERQLDCRLPFDFRDHGKPSVLFHISIQMAVIADGMEDVLEFSRAEYNIMYAFCDVENRLDKTNDSDYLDTE